MDRCSLGQGCVLARPGWVGEMMRAIVPTPTTLLNLMTCDARSTRATNPSLSGSGTERATAFLNCGRWGDGRRGLRDSGPSRPRCAGVFSKEVGEREK